MTLTPAQIAADAAQAGFSGQALITAVAIALAESGGVEAAVSSTGDYGLWQINLRYHPEVSEQCAFDPRCAAQTAYRLSSGGIDFSPWTTYQTGAYQDFLSQAQQGVGALGQASAPTSAPPIQRRWLPWVLGAAALAWVLGG